MVKILCGGLRKYREAVLKIPGKRETKAARSSEISLPSACVSSKLTRLTKEGCLCAGFSRLPFNFQGEAFQRTSVNHLRSPTVKTGKMNDDTNQ